MSTAIANDSRYYRFYAICALVIATHLVLITWFAIQKETFKPLKQPQRLMVQTIALNTPLQPAVFEKETLQSNPATIDVPKTTTPIDVETPKKIEEKPIIKTPKVEIKAPMTPQKVEKIETPTPPKIEQKKPLPSVKPETKKPLPVAKIEARPVPPKPKSTPKAPSPPTKTPPTKTPPAEPKAIIEPAKNLAAEAAAAKKKKLLAEAQSNLKMASSSSNNPATKNNTIALAEPPKTLSTLNSGSFENDISVGNSLENNYGLELTNRLKRLLKLPQYGDVDIQLTLLRSGKVSKLVITNSQNAMNKEHVEKTLPTFIFPPFGNGFAGEEQHIFKIRLSNDLLR
ncbi:MAG: hypothetical protein H0U49_08605 [Parachlamydiaceae bacterium]|nr:hypothetical protein [Parachlamydiaceae bacterium]